MNLPEIDPPQEVNWVPRTEGEISSVMSQLERVLAHELFQHSKRYPALLRYVVEQTLRGHADQIKERSIGVEVFGRDGDYDATADPIVRTTAREVRKRLAQYYIDHAHSSELRIELHAGSYVPVIESPNIFNSDSRPQVDSGSSVPTAEVTYLGSSIESEELNTSPSAASRTPAQNLNSPLPHYQKRLMPAVSRWLLPALILLVILIAGSGYLYWGHYSPFQQFWQPVWNSADSVLICVGEQNRSTVSEGSTEPTVNQYLQSSDHILIPDGIAISELTGLIQAAGHKYSIQSASATTFTGLQQEPVVLVGGLNNDWTLRLLNNTRYQFTQTEADRKPGKRETIEWNGWPLSVVEKEPLNGPFLSSIVDTRNPAGNHWDIDLGKSYLKLAEDYAIVARIHYPDSEHIAVVVAGLGAQGTVVASEFLTEPKYLNAFLKEQAPAHWQKMNIEVVVGAEMIKGKPGPPRVLAASFW